MKKLFFSLGILLIFSIAIAQPYKNLDMIRIQKPIANDAVRLIVNTSLLDDKQQFVEKGCKIVHELEEETAIECPTNVAKSIPNAVEDRRYNLMIEETSQIIPKDANIQDLVDNNYLGVPKIWEKGITGKGRVVAILDTGIDYNHPSLKNDILANKSFVKYTNNSMDDNSHGTHVAGIITSDGNPETCFDETVNGLIKVPCEEPHNSTVTISKDLSKGISPDAKIIMGKVCDNEGICLESDIKAGLLWAVKGFQLNSSASCYEKCKTSNSCCQRTEGCSYINKECTGNYMKTEMVKPDAISISLGRPFGTYMFRNCDKEPFAKFINNISTRYNIPIVISAGNEVYGVSVPACARYVIAAGAVGGYGWDCFEDETSCWYRNVASFSSRGYAMKDHGVLAPGVYVFSTLPNNNFGFMSGTSMSAPYVAGLIALIKQEHPTYSSSSLKSRLFGTATDVQYGFIFLEDGYKNYEQGHGLIKATAV